LIKIVFRKFNSIFGKKRLTSMTKVYIYIYNIKFWNTLNKALNKAFKYNAN